LPFDKTLLKTGLLAVALTTYRLSFSYYLHILEMYLGCRPGYRDLTHLKKISRSLL
jgi:hypothetical protein